MQKPSNKLPRTLAVTEMCLIRRDCEIKGKMKRRNPASSSTFSRIILQLPGGIENEEELFVIFAMICNMR